VACSHIFISYHYYYHHHHHYYHYCATEKVEELCCLEDRVAKVKAMIDKLRTEIQYKNNDGG